MPDRCSSEERSRIMARVRSKGTRPEMLVRHALHRLGYRYRLHRSDLSGKPDLAFPSRRKALFINGCFWHVHPGCPRARMPQNNQDYWVPKLERNRLRDSENLDALRNRGWEAMTVWECELRDLDSAVARIVSFLGDPGPIMSDLHKSSATIPSVQQNDGPLFESLPM